MRFLRILPAVWAMISWPFCRRTRKVALGSNSLTVPSNSSNSSLAIRPQLISGEPGRRLHRTRAKSRILRIIPDFLAKIGDDPAPQTVSDGAIGGFALFQTALF